MTIQPLTPRVVVSLVVLQVPHRIAHRMPWNGSPPPMLSPEQPAMRDYWEKHLHSEIVAPVQIKNQVVHQVRNWTNIY